MARKLGKTTQTSKALENDAKVEKTSQDKIIITVSREYGSGGRYVGKLLADRMHLPFYDKELISLAAKESGLSSTYIIKNDEIMASSKSLPRYPITSLILTTAPSKVIGTISVSNCFS